MDIKSAVKDFAEKSLPGQEFFIVDVKVTGKANQQKVLILVDGDKGISIDDCAEISRKVGDLLEASDLFPGAFQLEVSSPGADEPIRTPRQYLKNLGRRFEILNEDDELVIGKLESVKEDSLILIPEGKKKKASGKDKQEEPVMLELPYSKIKKSNVIISFK
jgi:ribosome maturation factor RimP